MVVIHAWNQTRYEREMHIAVFSIGIMFTNVYTHSKKVVVRELVLVEDAVILR